MINKVAQLRGIIWAFAIGGIPMAYLRLTLDHRDLDISLRIAAGIAVLFGFIIAFEPSWWMHPKLKPWKLPPAHGLWLIGVSVMAFLIFR